MKARGRKLARLITTSFFVFVACFGIVSTHAQQARRDSAPILIEKPDLGPLPGSFGPNMGPSPGAMDPSRFSPGSATVIGGRARGGSGRVPRKLPKARPSPGDKAMSLPGRDLGMEPGTVAPSTSATAFADDEGPSSGLGLDAAINRLIASNLDLQALRQEIPQADADVLTAGLRANPLIYGDTQFIPYGANFTNTRPGGPTQYDVNITYPIDVSGKRLARVRTAGLAKSGIEAQYQDAVRRQVGSLYRAFVDLQVARLNATAAEVAFKEQESIIDAADKHVAGRLKPLDNVERLTIELDQLRTNLDEAHSALDDAKEALALLLNLPPENASTLATRGRLRVPAPSVAPLEELTRIALCTRPDVIASRRGLGRAHSELTLARVNRFDDIFVFYDPITYQDNHPSRLPSSHSWGIGVTIPLPIFNRNQGNIARAHGNISQTQIELTAIERRVVSEVRLADREFRNSLNALPRIENSVLPRARKARIDAARDFAAGKSGVDDYIDHLNDEADASKQYRDALVRYRRSMLDLNTTVGLRILP